jgi:hypothetical protein
MTLSPRPTATVWNAEQTIETSSKATPSLAFALHPYSQSLQMELSKAPSQWRTPLVAVRGRDTVGWVWAGSSRKNTFISRGIAAIETGEVP